MPPAHLSERRWHALIVPLRKNHWLRTCFIPNSARHVSCGGYCHFLWWVLWCPYLLPYHSPIHPSLLWETSLGIRVRGAPLGQWEVPPYSDLSQCQADLGYKRPVPLSQSRTNSHVIYASKFPCLVFLATPSCFAHSPYPETTLLINSLNRNFQFKLCI